MERDNSVSHHLLILLIPNTHKLPLFISHTHKMLFFGPNLRKHLLSLLEVPKLVTLGCSVELTRAWQHISHQHKEGAAEADCASKWIRFLFLWLGGTESNSKDVNGEALPRELSKVVFLFLFFLMHIQERRDRARSRQEQLCVRAFLPPCLPWTHCSALLLYSGF